MRFLIFDLLKYRRGIVHTNLCNSFPDKTTSEIAKIQRDFELYFCDLTLETIKTLSIRPATLQQHVTFENTELVQSYYESNQSIILAAGHIGNWELMGAAFGQIGVHKLYVIYHPLRNKAFDQLLYHMRTRLGNGLYSMKDTVRGMIRDRGHRTGTVFIADQTPSSDRAHWTVFLNQDTPIFTGIERISKKLKYPVIFLSIRQPRRGHYVARFELVSADPASEALHVISEKYTQMLENDIHKQPAIWLWTHRRWKHTKPVNPSDTTTVS